MLRVISQAPSCEMELTMLSFYHEVTLYKLQKPQGSQCHFYNKDVHKVSTT